MPQALRDLPATARRARLRPRSSRYLNCSSNLISHDRHPNKPANGVGNNRAFLTVDRSRARGGRPIAKKGVTMFQGHIDLDSATPVVAAIPDVLFEARPVSAGRAAAQAWSISSPRINGSTSPL